MQCPRALLCIDPYHLVAWANDALDRLRRKRWNDAPEMGAKLEATAVKGDRYVIRKNSENLTDGQKERLSAIDKLNRPLYRGYLLK